MTTDEMRADSDWREAFAFAATEHCRPTVQYTGSCEGFTIDDVAEVIASAEGENDGAEWLAVLRLRDGRFAFLAAGCDYTGWDCQADGRTWFAATLDDLTRWALTDDARLRLREQLTAHGVET
jgi:hypothetical protein